MRKHLDRAEMYEKMGNTHKARQHRARAGELQMSSARSSYAFGGDDSFFRRLGNFFSPKQGAEDNSSIREKKRVQIRNELLKDDDSKLMWCAEANVNEAKIGQLEAKLEAKTMEHEVCKTEHDVCKGKVTQNLTELSEYKATRAKLEAEIKKLQSNQAGHEEIKGQVEKHVADLSQCKDEMTTAIKELRSQLASSEADLLKSKQNSETMAGEIEALKAQLEKANEQAQNPAGASNSAPPPPPKPPPPPPPAPPKRAASAPAFLDQPKRSPSNNGANNTQAPMSPMEQIEQGAYKLKKVEPSQKPKKAPASTESEIASAILKLGLHQRNPENETDDDNVWDFGRIMAFGSSRMKTLKVELAVVNDCIKQVLGKISRVLKAAEKECSVVTKATITYVRKHMQNVRSLEKQLEEINVEINAEKDRATVTQMSRLVR